MPMKTNILYNALYFYLFWAVLGLRYCEGFSLIEASGGYFSAMMCGLLIVVASLVAKHGL